jgi:hypothetical protein
MKGLSSVINGRCGMGWLKEFQINMHVSDVYGQNLLQWVVVGKVIWRKKRLPSLAKQHLLPRS